MNVLLIHLFAAIGSDFLLMLTAVTSLVYLRQDYVLKHKKQVISLPSIQVIDAWSLYLLIAAFVLMTIGILAGSRLAYLAWGSDWYLDLRQIWSLAIWVLFAGVLFARFWVGWRGRLAAWVTLVGVSLMLLGFFVLHFIDWSRHYEL